MHRSGTSLVCQLLHESGFDFGSEEQFYPTDRWNIRGYFELRPIVDLNSKLITGIPKTRSRLHSILSQCVYMTMPERISIERRSGRYAEELNRLAADCAGLAVKDPRFCLTLPVWLNHCEVEKIIVCIRHPAKVARSLKSRQQLPRGLALRFWAYHIRSLLERLPLQKTWFFDVDRFSSNRDVQRLDEALRFLNVSADDKCLADIVNKVFEGDLMSNHAENEPDLPAEVRRLWDRISTIAEDRGQGAVPA